MKKLLMTLAAVASLGFVLSCSDEVLEVNLNKDSETIKESFTRLGKIEGTYEVTFYHVVRDETQPMKTVYKNPTSGNRAVPEKVVDDTFKKETINGIDFWVRKVVNTTSFTARESEISWDKTYANFASTKSDTTYKDYYTKENSEGQLYRIDMNSIEYGVPTLTFNGKTMTKNYDYNTQSFDADTLEAKYAEFSLLSKGNLKIETPYCFLYKVGNTYLDGSNYKEVTFDGNLEDGNIQNLSFVSEYEQSAKNSDGAVVKPAAWTNTYKLTITKFERYNK